MYRVRYEIAGLTPQVYLILYQEVLPSSDTF